MYSVLVCMLRSQRWSQDGDLTEQVAFGEATTTMDPDSQPQSVLLSALLTRCPKTVNLANSNIDSIHQTGTKYRSNNAGDGPEKTRDRKSWFPRFKSNWLGTYRSKQMFHCCECAVADAQHARYKGSEGKHCVCGQDQWHLAKTIEEAEYNRRMEISKALGGLRYDEALERLKTMGTSEYDLKRIRCESDEASVTSTSSSVASVDDLSDSGTAHTNKRIKNEPLPSPATRAYSKVATATGFGLDQMAPGSNATGLTQELLQKLSSHHAYSSGSYTPLNGDYIGGLASYDHLVAAPFADEESFGELLQGFLEDDPRNTNSHADPSQYHRAVSMAARPSSQYGGCNPTTFLPGSTSDPSHQHRTSSYPQAPSTLPPPPVGDVDFEFFADGHRPGMAPPQPHLYSSYHQHAAAAQYGRPHLVQSHHPHSSSMAPPLTSSTSFSIV